MGVTKQLPGEQVSLHCPQQLTSAGFAMKVSAGANKIVTLKAGRFEPVVGVNAKTTQDPTSAYNAYLSAVDVPITTGGVVEARTACYVSAGEYLTVSGGGFLEATQIGTASGASVISAYDQPRVAVALTGTGTTKVSSVEAYLL